MISCALERCLVYIRSFVDPSCLERLLWTMYAVIFSVRCMRASVFVFWDKERDECRSAGSISCGEGWS